MGKWPDGETALREQRRKARWRGTAGMEQSPLGRCGLPLFYGGERKGEQLLSKKGAGENVFAGGEKKWNDPLPAGRESC